MFGLKVSEIKKKKMKAKTNEKGKERELRFPFGVWLLENLGRKLQQMW